MKRHTSTEVKVSNKGRITRADQAWDAAHREASERSRIIDPDIAHSAALEEAAARDPAPPASSSTVVTLHDPDLELDAGGTLKEVPQPGPLQTLAVPLKFVTSALLTAAKQDIRYYLNGIYVHAVDDEVRVVSTDGHRLIVSRFEPGKDFPIPEWARAGVIIPRDELTQALPVLSKNTKMHPSDCSDPAMLIDFGAGHEQMTLRAVNGFAAFRMKPVDGKFPDYIRVMAGQGATLARGETDALVTSAIKSEYLKSVGDIAGRLGATAVHSFIGDNGNASLFTFEGAPNTVFIVMPMRTGEAVSEGVAKLMGRDGMQASISALKAHVTRTVKALEHAEDADRKAFEDRKASLEQRIAVLLAATGQGPKQLTQQPAA